MVMCIVQHVQIILRRKLDKKKLRATWPLVAVSLSSYNGTRDAWKTLGYRLMFYTHFSYRYNSIITRDTCFIS